ncbi:MAG TPA: hypothetical protein VGL22_14855 [Terracidiphilus sp.]
MQSFFNDLDGLTVFTTLVVVVIGILLVLYTAGERPRSIARRRYGYYVGMVIVCLSIAWDAYCPDADQPHIRATGWAWPVESYTYHSGKSTHTGLIACINSCDDTDPRLALDEYAAYLFRHGAVRPGVSVTYLGRTEKENIGNIRTVPAHPVVEIDSVTDGRRLFYRDTTRHWPRVIVLLSDFVFGMGMMAVCWTLRGREEEGDSAWSNDGQQNELLGLGLGGAGRQQ